jgi:hypothetical protein
MEGQNFTTLELEIRQQHSAKGHQPEQASYRSDQASSIGNVKPPLGVSTIDVYAVNIELHFSCIRSPAPLSRKRPSSELDGSLHLVDQPMIPRCAMRGPLISDECINHAEKEQEPVSMNMPGESSTDMLDDTHIANISTAHSASSEEIFSDLFNNPSGDCSDDTQSLAFSSQGSKVLFSEDAPPSPPSSSSSEDHNASMNMLLDRAFRSSICPRPLQMAAGIKQEKCSLRARLIDIAPSIFSPGYNEAVAVRARLVPTVARFLTSFLQKSRSPSVSGKKDDLIRQCSGMTSAENDEVVDQSRNEETRLKEMVKTHLWMTMTNSLRDSKPARRLKPLQAFSKPTFGKSDGSLGTDDIVHGCGAIDQSSDNEMLGEGFGVRPEPIDHEALTTDGIQDVDDEDDEEADEYEANLMEEYEDRLIRGFDHGETDEFELLHDDHEDCFERSRRPSDYSALQSPSSMLEGSGILHLPDPFSHSWAVTPAQAPSDVPATPELNSDDRWSNLLDEEAMCEIAMIAEPDISTEYDSHVDHEPDFEQWEFDEEQGFDNMLFD